MSPKTKQLTIFDSLGTGLDNPPPPIQPNELEYLLVEKIRDCPGITTEQLCDYVKMSPADVVPVLRHRLLKKGKIKDLGWALADDVSLHHNKISGDRQNELSLHHDKEFSLDASLRHDKFTDKPRVVWLRPGGRETAYPWFQCGKKRTYIGGGPIGSSVAESRVATVRAWIDQKVAPDEICDRIKWLKLGQLEVN